jgi:hypothetical protein
MATFDELVAEGSAVPVDGWDFSWFAGRATEERPSWGYARLMGERMSTARRALDLQTGGGEVLASIPRPPEVLVATEGWPANAALARERLGPLGGKVVDLGEVARVLAPGGTYFSQHVGAGSLRELIDFMMGPQKVGRERDPELARETATDAGLDVVDLRSEALRIEFFDVAAVIVFLRKVIWTVPGFTVDAYRDRLEALHGEIEREGPFVAHSERFLIEARKPA